MEAHLLHRGIDLLEIQSLLPSVGFAHMWEDSRLRGCVGGQNSLTDCGPWEPKGLPTLESQFVFRQLGEASWSPRLPPQTKAFELQNGRGGGS